MIKVYKQELLDGLDIIQTDNSFVLNAQAMKIDGNQSLSSPEFLSLIKSDQITGDVSIASDLNNYGLYAFKSVMVSVGKNLNDDIFVRKNLWDSRNSPVNKQLNLMHDQSNIIGHITGTYAIDNDGQIIYDDNLPEKDFHIVSLAVVYKEWIDKNQKNKVNNIIAEIENTDKWFVSMECSFASFDYGLKSTNGEITIIERNEATAYLSKYLKRYGGNGVYQDYEVGRVLNEINFMGKALVDKPANPNSIIIKTKTFSQAQEYMENNNMPVTQEQFDAIKQELAAAKAECQDLKEKFNQETSKAKFDAYETQLNEKNVAIQNLEASLAKLKEDLSSVSTKLNDISALYEETNTKLTETANLNSELTQKISAYEKEKTLAKRSAMLAEAGVEDVESTLQGLSLLDDTAFDTVVAVMKKAKSKMGPEYDEMEKKKKEDEAKKMKESKANQESLDSAEETTSASVSDLDVSDEDDVATAASDYFEKLLKTTKKSSNNRK